MRSPRRRDGMAYFLPEEGSSSRGRSATGGSVSGRSRRLSRSARVLSCRGVRTPYMTITRRGNSEYPFTTAVSASFGCRASSLGAFFTDVQAAENPRRAASASLIFLFIYAMRFYIRRTEPGPNRIDDAGSGLSGPEFIFDKDKNFPLKTKKHAKKF